MPITGDQQGGMAFLERSGLISTNRNPAPRISPMSLLVHSLPLKRPHPAPEFLEEQRPACAASEGQTQPWPYSEES